MDSDGLLSILVWSAGKEVRHSKFYSRRRRARTVGTAHNLWWHEIRRIHEKVKLSTDSPGKRIQISVINNTGYTRQSGNLMIENISSEGNHKQYDSEEGQQHNAAAWRAKQFLIT